jgi:hypothetical protein
MFAMNPEFSLKDYFLSLNFEEAALLSRDSNFFLLSIILLLPRADF